MQPSRPPLSAPPEVLSGLLPVVPTPERRFARTDRLTTFVRVHQGGSRPMQSVALDLRIKDATGAVVFSAIKRIEPAGFGPGRFVDHTHTVSLSELAPGAYALAIDAALPRGDPAQRAVRFEVK